MKKKGLLNPEISAAVARLGHTDYLVIADPGLPLPNGVEVIDLSLVLGLPAFTDVLAAVEGEFVTESYIIASEMSEKSPQLYARTKELMEGLPEQRVSHEDFKKLTQQAKTIVRTGEATSYANIILVGGVNF